MVGRGTATLGRLLGKMPPREALIYIGGGTLERRSDTLRLMGVMESPFLGRRTFTGLVVDGRLHADLTRIPSGVKAGTMSGVRDSTDAALRDVRAGGRSGPRDPRYDLRSIDPVAQQYQRFTQALRERFSRARDDLDAWRPQALRPSLGISTSSSSVIHGSRRCRSIPSSRAMRP
jgi:hypothetical protein